MFFFLGGGVVKQADVELPGGYPKAPPMWRLKMQQVLDVCLCVCSCVCVCSHVCVCLGERERVQRVSE